MAGTTLITWLLTAAMAVLLLTGKGSFLIAGYNTANKEKKKRYNEKRLCRVMGSGLSNE
jgi:hypothetical protein